MQPFWFHVRFFFWLLWCEFTLASKTGSLSVISQGLLFYALFVFQNGCTCVCNNGAGLCWWCTGFMLLGLYFRSACTSILQTANIAELWNKEKKKKTKMIQQLTNSVLVQARCFPLQTDFHWVKLSSQCKVGSVLLLIHESLLMQATALKMLCKC